jgi:hypothetical protein
VGPAVAFGPEQVNMCGAYLVDLAADGPGTVLELVGRDPARHDVMSINLPQRDPQRCNGQTPLVGVALNIQ